MHPICQTVVAATLVAVAGAGGGPAEGDVWLRHRISALRRTVDDLERRYGDEYPRAPEHRAALEWPAAA